MAEIRYREALNQALREEMDADDSVFIMGEDIGVFQGAFKVTQGLLEEFGEKRVRDTPISENTIVGTGVGAAMTGLRPVVELMTINFSLLAYDQIVNHMATIHYMFGGQVRVPMVIRMPQGAGHQLGPTHSPSWEALYLHVPGLLVAVAVAVAFAGVSVATAEKGEPVPTDVIVVGTGVTLWDIASVRAEDGDVRGMISTIQELNRLDGGLVVAGQRLRVPAVD